MNLAELLPHVLRPAWLLGLLLLPSIWWFWRFQHAASNPWRRTVDAHLLPHLLESDPAARRTAPWLLMTALAIALFALAGPAWRREEAPVIAPAAPLVVALDLSSSMLAGDLPPSRNARMRIKLLQLIEVRGGQLGLVGYAGAAFTVAPLSDDAHSLSELVDALLPSVMPVDGQRADLAIARSAALLKQAGFTHGQILVLTDHADAAAVSAARAARDSGYTTSVLGVGTLAGAPVAGSDGFVSDAAGRVLMPRLDAASLNELAAAGAGRHAAMTASPGDLDALGLLDARGAAGSDENDRVHRDNATATRWRDDGPWLVLLLLPFALAGFRRGLLAATVLILAFAPMPRAEAAVSQTNHDWWSGLWQRDDQRAYQALRQGRAAQARALAKSSQIAAAAAYRAGDYPAAAQVWSHADSADAFYNHGNALTQLQQYPQAIESYDRALALQPGMRDALANRAFVQRLLQKKPQKQQQDQADKQQNHRGNQQQGQQQQAQQQQGQQQQGQQQQGQQQQGQQQPRQSHLASQMNQANAVPDDAAQRQRQSQANAAAQRAMQQALQRTQSQVDKLRAGKTPAESNAQREQREAIEQWLRQVPDDPGGLLRRKFAIEYQRRQAQGEQ